MAAAKKKARKKKSGADSAAAESFVILLDEPDPDEEPRATESVEHRVAFRSDCTIGDAAGIRQRLLNELQDKNEVTIDLAAIGNVDTAFLQVLCALQIEADERDITINWHEPPASFRASADLLGLSEYFRG